MAEANAESGLLQGRHRPPKNFYKAGALRRDKDFQTSPGKRVSVAEMIDLFNNSSSGSLSYHNDEDDEKEDPVDYMNHEYKEEEGILNDMDDEDHPHHSGNLTESSYEDDLGIENLRWDDDKSSEEDPHSSNGSISLTSPWSASQSPAAQKSAVRRRRRRSSGSGDNETDDDEESSPFTPNSQGSNATRRSVLIRQKLHELQNQKLELDSDGSDDDDDDEQFDQGRRKEGTNKSVEEHLSDESSAYEERSLEASSNDLGGSGIDGEATDGLGALGSSTTTTHREKKQKKKGKVDLWASMVIMPDDDSENGSADEQPPTRTPLWFESKEENGNHQIMKDDTLPFELEPEDAEQLPRVGSSGSLSGSGNSSNKQDPSGEANFKRSFANSLEWQAHLDQELKLKDSDDYSGLTNGSSRSNGKTNVWKKEHMASVQSLNDLEGSKNSSMLNSKSMTSIKSMKAVKEEDDESDYEEESSDDEKQVASSAGSSAMLSLLKDSSWQDLAHYVDQLRNEDAATIRQELLLRINADMDATHATPLHVAVSEAPLQLTKLMLSIIPFSAREDILLQTDSNGNTLLHLACENLQLQYDNWVDISVINVLSSGAPEVHDMKNKNGEIPLVLLLKSPALRAAHDSSEDRFDAEEVTLGLIKRILRERVDLAMTKTKEGMTLLHVAAAQGVHEKVLFAILKLAKFAVKAVDNYGRLPIHCLAECNTTPRPPLQFTIHVLECFPGSLEATTPHGDTPLHLFVSQIYHNIPKESNRYSVGLERMAGILLGNLLVKDENAKNPIILQNEKGWTPLHCAAFHAAPYTVLRVLKRNPSYQEALELTDNNFSTPLHLLCASPAIDILSENIELIGTAKAAITMDAKGRNPLHVVAGNENSTKQVVDVFARLNPKAAKQADPKGLLPIHTAVRNKASQEVVKAILRLHPKAVKTVLARGNTIFHEMCIYRAPTAVVHGLLYLYPEGAKIFNDLNNLPLHLAAIYQIGVDAIKIIEKAYPEACNIQNKKMEVPLHYACTHPNQIESVEYLVQACPSSIMTTNDEDDSPIDIAKKYGMDKVILKALNDASNRPKKKKKKKKKAEEKEAEKTPVKTEAPRMSILGSLSKISTKITSGDESSTSSSSEKRSLGGKEKASTAEQNPSREGLATSGGTSSQESKTSAIWRMLAGEAEKVERETQEKENEMLSETNTVGRRKSDSTTALDSPSALGRKTFVNLKSSDEIEEEKLFETPKRSSSKKGVLKGSSKADDSERETPKRTPSKRGVKKTKSGLAKLETPKRETPKRSASKRITKTKSMPIAGVDDVERTPLKRTKSKKDSSKTEGEEDGVRKTPKRSSSKKIKKWKSMDEELMELLRESPKRTEFKKGLKVETEKDDEIVRETPKRTKSKKSIKKTKSANEKDDGGERETPKRTKSKTKLR